MKMGKKEILFWAVLGIFALGLGFALPALITHREARPKNSILNPDGVTEKQASAQAQVVSKTLSHHAKTSAANMEAVLNEMKSIKITTQDIKSGR